MPMPYDHHTLTSTDVEQLLSVSDVAVRNNDDCKLWFSDYESIHPEIWRMRAILGCACGADTTWHCDNIFEYWLRP